MFGGGVKRSKGPKEENNTPPLGGLSHHLDRQEPPQVPVFIDEESLYTADDSCDPNPNARPPATNPNTLRNPNARPPTSDASSSSPGNNLLDTSFGSHNSSRHGDSAPSPGSNPSASLLNSNFASQKGVGRSRRDGTPPPHPNRRQVEKESYDLSPLRGGPTMPESFHSDTGLQDAQLVPPDSADSDSIADSYGEDDDLCPMDPHNDCQHGGDATFFAPGDIHPHMESKEDDIVQLRLLAGKLNADWRGSEFMAPALARRIRDFQFAQEKRRKKYGDERPWGILGLYDFLSAIRTDVEWAEDAAWRRANGDSYYSWADFDESRKKGYNRPFFTYFLLVVCSVTMIGSIVVNDWQVEPLDVNPMIGPSAQTLIKMGAKDSTKIIDENEGWRLVSSTVLHAGLVHFLVNMLALWFVGGAIERSHGWFASMVIFCISAVGGTILSGIFLPEYITVGASGGIFGFIGACIADIIMNWNLLFCDFVAENGKKHRHILVVVVLFMDIALNSIIGLTPFVDNFTHLGGMAYGFLCGLSTMQRLSMDFFGVEDTVFTQAKHFVVRFFGIILSVLSLVATLMVLLNMDSNSTPCPECTWLSCVPFPPWEPESNKWWHCDDCNSVSASIINQPYASLEMDCPGGDLALINITGTMDRKDLQKRLPSYCREYCPQTKV